MIRLKELREQRGWNMKQAARELGLPYTTYVSYEKQDREANSELLIKFSEFYNVSIDYLIGATDDPTKRKYDSDGNLPPITMIARAGRKMTPEQQETLLKFAQFTFPEAFEEDE